MIRLAARAAHIALLPTLILLGVGAAHAQSWPGYSGVSQCTTNLCGLWVSAGSAPPTCSPNFSQIPPWMGSGSCRTPSGCSCESNCYLYRDCCSSWFEVCARPVLFSPPSPASGSTAGNTSVTVTGTFFDYDKPIRAWFDGVERSVTQASTNGVAFTTPAGVGNAHAVTVSDSTGTRFSNSINFPYDPPLIASISPTSASGGGGTTLTITGTNFGTSSSVTIGASACPVTFQSHTSVECTIPGGSGTGLLVRMVVGNQNSNTKTFDYVGAQLDSVNPTSGPTAGNSILTIAGSNLSGVSSVTVGGANCPITAPIGATILCTLPAGQGTNQNILAYAGSTPTNAIDFDYVPPSVASISATSYPTAGGTLLTIDGDNFGTTPTVKVAGATCPITFASHSSIRCTLPAGEGVNQGLVVTAANQDSPAFPLSYAAPVTSAINPTSGTAAGNISLTVNGNHFGTTASVAINGVNCPVQTRSHTELVCTVPSGSGSNLPVTVSVQSQTSNPQTFSYTGPHIDSISPLSGPSTGNIPLQIDGTNFAVGATVSVGGANCPTSNVTTTQITCTLPAGTGANKQVIVAASGTPSNAATFNYLPPTISNVIASNAGTAGNSALTIIGSSFNTSGTATVDGKACPIQTYGPAMITCTLPAGQGMNVPVVVTAAQQSSAGYPFSYTPPTLASVSSTSAPTTGNVPITLTGSNFGTASTVTVDNSPCPVTLQGHTSVECTLPAGAGKDLNVVLSAGNQNSNARLFSYTPPAILSIDPTHGPTIGGHTLTINGSNFGTTNTVTVDGSPCSVATQNSSSITCSIPFGQGAGRSVVVQTGNQSSNAAPFDYDGPQITSVQPSSGPPAGNIPITINGLNFGSTGSVTVGGAPCPRIAHADFRIVCTLPAGSAGPQALDVTIGGQVTQTTFTYEEPTPTATPTATSTPTPTPICPETPLPNCRASGKSTFSLKDNPDSDDKDQLSWSWLKGEATDVSALGDPRSTTDYRFCVYANGTSFLSLLVPPGGTCSRGKPCWDSDRSPFKYGDAAGSAMGVTKLSLKAGEAGKASVQLKGKGVNLPDLTLPPALPLTAQLVSSENQCWATTYAGPATTSDTEGFKVKYSAP